MEKLCSEIKTDKAEMTIKHPRELKKLLEKKKKKIAKKNSKSILLDTLDFDPEEYLDKSLLFNLRKTSKEKIFDAILEKILDNDNYYIKHKECTNGFRIRKDEKHVEKDEIIKFIETIDSKIKKVRINQQFHS